MSWMEHKVRVEEGTTVQLHWQPRTAVTHRFNYCCPQQATAVPLAQLLVAAEPFTTGAFVSFHPEASSGAALGAFFCLMANTFFVELVKKKLTCFRLGQILDRYLAWQLFFPPCSCCGNGPLKIVLNTCGDPLKMMSKSWGTNASLATGEDRAENLLSLKILLMMSRGR